MAMAFSTDGRLLATGGYDHVIRLWDPQPGGSRGVLGKPRNDVSCLALVPHRSRVVTGQRDGSLRVWDIGEGSLVAAASAHSGEVTSLALSPAGDTAYSGGRDGTLKIWALPELKLEKVLACAEASVNSVAASAGGTWLAWAGQRKVEKLLAGFVSLQNASTGQPGAEIEEWGEVPTQTAGGYWQVRAVAISPDESLLASAVGHEVRLWETASGKPRGTLSGGGDRFLSRVITLAFSPDGRIVAAGTVGYEVRLWDVETRKLLRKLRAKRDSIASLAFSPDGCLMALSTEYDDRAWLHDSATGELVGTFEGHANAVLAVAFSNDGALLVTGGEDGLVKIWDVKTRRVLRTLVPP
jgi:WD40 repeat protein